MALLAEAVTTLLPGQVVSDAIRPGPDSMALLAEAVTTLLPGQVVAVVVPWVLGPPR